MKGLWKRFAAGISAVALTIGWHGQAAEAVPERYVVACVGDSITEGIGATSPVLYSYPAQLQKLLGERYEVHNCGSGGTTLLKSGDFSYRKQSRYPGKPHLQSAHRDHHAGHQRLQAAELGQKGAVCSGLGGAYSGLPEAGIQAAGVCRHVGHGSAGAGRHYRRGGHGRGGSAAKGGRPPNRLRGHRRQSADQGTRRLVLRRGVHPNNDGYAQLAAAFADVLSQRYDPGIVRQWSARLDALPSNPDAGYASEVEALRFTLGQFSERQAALVTDQQKKRLAAMEEAVKRTTAAPRVTTTQPTAASQPTTTSGAAVTTAPTSPTQAATASEAPLTTASAVTGLPTTTGSNATTAAAQHTSSAVIWWVLGGRRGRRRGRDGRAGMGAPPKLTWKTNGVDSEWVVQYRVAHIIL